MDEMRLSLTATLRRPPPAGFANPELPMILAAPGRDIRLRGPRRSSGRKMAPRGSERTRRALAMTLIKRILVPTDFSDSARQALDWGVSLAREFKAEVTLFHVVENLTVGYASDLFPVPMAEVYEEISGYARSELQKLAESVRAQGIPVTERLAQGTPSAEIIRLAKEEPVDLVVLGSHGKGLLDHALFGSTTERVVRKAPCPVLTCRPRKE